MKTFNGKNVIDIYNEIVELETQEYDKEKINAILKVKYGNDVDSESIKEMKEQYERELKATTEREEKVNKIGTDFFDLKQQGYTPEKINEVLILKYGIKENEIESIITEKKALDERKKEKLEKEMKEKKEQERREKAKKDNEELKDGCYKAIVGVIIFIILFILIPGPGNCFYGG